VPRWRGRAGNQGSHLPPLEKALQEHADRGHETHEGTGEGERLTEKTSPSQPWTREHLHPLKEVSGEPSEHGPQTNYHQARIREAQSPRTPACRVIGQPRSTQRYLGWKTERDRPLTEETILFSKENPRYGYPEGVGACEASESFGVNKKQVYGSLESRVAGLKEPAAQRKRRCLLGVSENGCTK
jgi:hypothetical protein